MKEVAELADKANDKDIDLQDKQEQIKKLISKGKKQVF